MALNFANNNSLSAITTKPSGLSGGALNLISTQTASSSSTISFTSGIDSTYDEYVFKFIDIHPDTVRKDFTFQADTGTNTSYNQTMTTTFFRAFHNEADTSASLSYDGGRDQAQGSAFQQLLNEVSIDNDGNGCGVLQLFNPSSTTFVKHFIFRGSVSYNEGSAPAARDHYVAGYFNTTTAITRVQFKMSGGNIDSGVIKLYGIS
jgi:hypothetical protein